MNTIKIYGIDKNRKRILTCGGEVNQDGLDYVLTNPRETLEQASAEDNAAESNRLMQNVQFCLTTITPRKKDAWQ